MQEAIRYRFDMNDDIANIIDAVLTAPGIRIRYKKEGPRNWISMIGNQEMEDGIRALPELEQDIIEMFFLKEMSLIDISSVLGIPMDLLMGHLKAIRVRLELYV